ncbi:MAG: hypothetical protein ACRDL6_11045 [Solirubrobacterales bacterium]
MDEQPERQQQGSNLHHLAQTNSQLAELGLTEELLAGAVRHGYEEAANTTGNDVRSMGGWLRWGKPLRYLRDRLVPKGWTNQYSPHLETVISPNRKVQITCAIGTGATGDPEHMPSTSLDKGPLTGVAVGLNRQMSFPRSVHPEFGEPDPPPTQTWFLLYYLDEIAGEIRYELSVPTHFTGAEVGENTRRGYLNEWGPRICLPPISIDDQAAIEEEEEDDIEIPVERRGDAAQSA